MKINQKQFERYKVLHNHLSKSQGKTHKELALCCKDELALQFGPSRRTIMLDLAFFRSEGAEISCINGYYKFAKPFSLFGILNPDELKLANEIKALFSQYAQLPQISGLEDIHLQIEERINIDSTSKPEVIVNFEQNNIYTGQKHLIALYNAIKDKKTLKIHFQDFSKSKTEYSISPYMLKEYHNRWHVYGYEHKKGKIYNLALDRILAIDEASIFKYREQKANDLAFLNDIIGFTYLYDAETETYAALETIKIKVELPRANYIRTKPLHHSQQEVSEETSETHLVFTYQLRFNNELFAKLLEFGKDLEILEPLHLREKMIEHIREMARKYGM